MRLLDVDTLQLHEFVGYHMPKYQYAILSHTWAEDEVSLQELEAGSGLYKQGYKKIVLTCEQSKRNGYRWAWVDTCCIDKTSSGELSEAINSMYQYGSRVSRWLTRAWTLQELIAPSRIIFYGRGWAEIGRQSEEWVQRSITFVTGIPRLVISTRKYSLSDYSMSRTSLLGLLDINMPLLYGKGDKAFMRLQEEILKETDDHSLLCWTVPRLSPRAGTLEGVFAKSPDDFAESGIMWEIFTT
ncbi:HET-domain-containing protein [Daldinia bambusicola]|nr:HET-domain-containing protein [Daldinia bambusicola]